MKFGGTSLSDSAAFDRVTHIVSSYHRVCSLVVVVSAMDGMTDSLLLSADLSGDGAMEKAVQLLEEQRRRHLAVTQELTGKQARKIQSFIHQRWRELVNLLKLVNKNRTATAKLKDAIVSFGEVLSARLLTAILQKEGLPAVYLDARRCITTNKDHGAAKPLFQTTRRKMRAQIIPLLKSGKIPVLGGFIASTKRGVTTTLGRGSSDYTATLISAALGARETQIWTDVNGVLTADPGTIKDARSVPVLSFAEAAELSRFGAKVLHPKSIQPASQTNVPLRVFNSQAPEFPGTLICERLDHQRKVIKALAYKTGITMIRIALKPGFEASDFSRIDGIFQQHHAAADVVAKSETVASLACEQSSGLPDIVRDLKQFGSVRVTEERAIICCVGAGWLKGGHRAISSLTAADPSITWQRASDVSLIADVPQECASSLVAELHQRIFDDELDRERPLCPPWSTDGEMLTSVNVV
jgi:aspartate kinase